MMPAFDQFAWPWAFALLAAPALMLLARGIRRDRSAIAFSGQRFSHDGPAGLRASLAWMPLAVRTMALVVLVFAIARPQTITGEVRTRTDGIAIQLVVDRSSSMNEPMEIDGQQRTRMEVVKSVASAFVLGDNDTLQGREGDLIGMIAFARFADTVCPMVREHETLAELINGLRTASIRSEDGTAIGEAIALAAARLRTAEEEVAASIDQSESLDSNDDNSDFRIASKAIVLLTDGQNNKGGIDPIDAGRFAADWGIRIYAIGIGGDRTVNIGGVRRSFGSGVDQRTLKQIADVSGGRFWLAENADALRDIYREINELETTEIESSVSTNTEERFAPFAAISLAFLVLEALLSTLGFRRLP